MRAIEGSEHFNFVEKDLFVGGVWGKDSAGLGEGFGSETSLISGSFNLIDGGEASLTKSSDGFVELVEAILVEILAEVFNPDVEERLTFEVKVNWGVFSLEKSEANFFGIGPDLLLKVEVLLEEDFKLEVELEVSVIKVVAELRVRGADGQVEVGHGKSNFLGHVAVGEHVGVQADGVFLDGRADLLVGSVEDQRLGIYGGFLLHWQYKNRWNNYKFQQVLFIWTQWRSS